MTVTEQPKVCPLCKLHWVETAFDFDCVTWGPDSGRWGCRHCGATRSQAGLAAHQRAAWDNQEKVDRYEEEREIRREHTRALPEPRSERLFTKDLAGGRHNERP